MKRHAMAETLPLWTARYKVGLVPEKRGREQVQRFYTADFNPYPGFRANRLND